MSDMNTGDVCRRLGVNVSGELLSSLGIEPAERNRRASLYSEAQWPTICKAVSRYVASRIDAPTPPRPAKPEKAPKVKPTSGSTDTKSMFKGDDDDEL